MPKDFKKIVSNHPLSNPINKHKLAHTPTDGFFRPKNKNSNQNNQNLRLNGQPTHKNKFKTKAKANNSNNGKLGFMDIEKFVKIKTWFIPKYTKLINSSILSSLGKFLTKAFGSIFAVLFGVLFFWTVPIFKFSEAQAQYLWKWLNIRDNMIRFSFGLLFFVMIFNLFNLQVLGNGPLGSNTKTNPINTLATTVIPAKKGNIYIKDLAQVRNDIPVTSNTIKYNAVFDPSNLEANIPIIKAKLNLKTDQETVIHIADFVASRTNISRQELIEAITIQLKNLDQSNSQTKDQAKKSETKNPINLIWEAIFLGKKPKVEEGQDLDKNTTQTQNNNRTKNYGTLKKNITEDQAKAINLLRSSEDKTADIYYFDSWLSQPEQINVRSYPEGKLMSQTLGYGMLNPVNSTEAKKVSGCKDMVVKNQERGTELLPNYDGSYQVGNYGIEQKYCSTIAGLNGKPIANKDLTNQEIIKNQNVQNGADIYLTIDKNIQKKAESILEEAVTTNTNNIGSPKDGCIMVMEASTGRILAMASYPSFDPNFYADYLKSNGKSIINSCTRNDFEVGSVMKPLTVAVALNEKSTDINAGFRYTDYDSDGKPYKNGEDTIKIKNARNFSWRSLGTVGLKEMIRDSINTGIAEIVDKMGNKLIKDYFLDKLQFGRYGEDDSNLLNFAGDMNGNTQSFETDINCVYCYAAKGFGQGFSISVLQLVRAYTAIANGGNLVQPQIVEKIQCGDGTKETLDGGNASCVSNSLKLKTNTQNPVFAKTTADLVTSYMLAANEEGFLGSGPTKAMVPGYRVAIKSGTAQVSRPITLANGETKPCSQDCNTQRGIYDHTMIGFNTGASRYIVMIKLAEPKPGQVDNFSSTTLAPFFSEMCRYTLEYLGVPKER